MRKGIHPRCPIEVIEAEVHGESAYQVECAGDGCLLEATYRPLDGLENFDNAVVLTSKPDCAAAGLCRMLKFRRSLDQAPAA